MSDLNKQLINSFIQQSVHGSWYETLSKMDSLHNAIMKLVKLKDYTPVLNDVLNAFRYCELNKLSVVFLGQD